MKIVTLLEVAKYLGVSKETLYRWVKTNKIPHHKIGKLIKFDLEEIDIWVKSK